MLRIAILKKPLLNRPLAIVLSVAVLVIVGFGLNLHLPAILLSALLFASSYLLESEKTNR